MKHKSYQLAVYLVVIILAFILVVALSTDSRWYHVAVNLLAGVLAVAVITHADMIFLLPEVLRCMIVWRSRQIRCSLSYMIRIRLSSSEYVLVWSDRFKHFGPVGGVYKRLSTARSVLDHLAVEDDKGIAICDSTMGDLRIRVRGRNLPALRRWFNSGEDREFGPWREFYDELIAPASLDRNLFASVMFRWIRQHDNGVHYSTHFDLQEWKAADIFEAELTEEQGKAIRDAVKAHPKMLRLADSKEICARGVTGDDPAASISETGAWILES
ncbi:MAG: hypothetical protein HQ559_10195 [Lentisphaerae bacterium]|nr:hypothetical protein [Lentisphaerota bacterium]